MPDRVLRSLADATADQVRDYLATITEVAAGANPGAAISLLGGVAIIVFISLPAAPCATRAKRPAS